MLRKTIAGKNGYDIPCIINISGGEKIVAVISHGFGGSKDNRTAQAFAALPSDYGMGTICFDFPAHGESTAGTNMLRVQNCVNDLETVSEYAKKLAPDAEIVYFATSFGAYITLIFLSLSEKKGRKAFLRGAALNMPQILKNNFMTGEQKPDSGGLIELIIPIIGSFKVPYEFAEELENYNVFELCRSGAFELAMMHGCRDDICSVEDARRFALQTGARLIEVSGANHFYYPGGDSRAIKEAFNFFRQGVLKNLELRILKEEEVLEATEKVWKFFIEREAKNSPIETAISFRKKLIGEAAAGTLKIFGAFVDGSMVGAAALNKGLSNLLIIALKVEFTGYGIPQMLFEHLLKESGVNRITANIPRYALELYQNLGFVPQAEEFKMKDVSLVPLAYVINDFE